MKNNKAVASSVLLTTLFSLAVSLQQSHAAPVVFGACSTGTYSETAVGSDTVATFTAPAGATSTGCTWNVPSGVFGVRVLVVGGGGGGGGYLTSGGGGAGGVVESVGYEVTPGSSVSVAVGKGGGPGSNSWGSSRAVNNGTNGDGSSFGSLTALGGGGGGGGGTNSQIGFSGNDGASGGGGGRCWVSCNTSSSQTANFRGGGVASSGQGTSGGRAYFMGGGGGGGASVAGGNSVYGLAGAGGNGITNDIMGSSTVYGGGGGGGCECASSAVGGGGGGGSGGYNSSVNGTAATASSGGGGGGAGTGTAGSGGSGSVIVRWSTNGPTAPSFTLSQTSGYLVQNVNVGTLYTISNTGGAISRFSISPALSSGLTFDSQTGLVSGTPTSLSSSTVYSITGQRIDSTNGSISTLTRQFSLQVGATATTTTTTTTLAPTTTTVAPTTTTVAPTTTTSNSQGQSAVATIPSTVPGATTTTIPVAKSGAVNVVTTTTITPTTTSTTTTIPSPIAPSVAAGGAGALVDGEETAVTMSRDKNVLIAKTAGVTVAISGESVSGDRIALDADGNLRLKKGDRIPIETSGWAADTEVQVWMYSTPSKLGTITADSEGKIKQSFALPSGLEVGDHRVVLVGKNAKSQNVTLAIGLSYGTLDEGSLAARLLIIVPVSLAILFGLLVPATRRRRKLSA